MKLRQLASNMTELELNGGIIVLFSYETPVAAFKPTGFSLNNETFTTMRTDKKWSVTTSKHINKWLTILDQKGIGDTSAIPVDQSVLDDLVSGSI